MTHESPLCPRLEAQIHRVLSAFQKAWKMGDKPEEAKAKRPQRAVSEPKARLAAYAPLQNEVIAYIQANPSAKQDEILREVGCDRKTLWRARQKLKAQCLDDEAEGK